LLDLDDNTGKDKCDRWMAVVYLADFNGSVNLSRNFNRMVVDSGNALINDLRITSLTHGAGRAEPRKDVWGLRDK
jgi:hypothetical protein